MLDGFNGGDNPKSFGQIVGRGKRGVDWLRSWGRIPWCHLDTGRVKDGGGDMSELERLGSRVMHLTFFAFPFSLFSSLLHSRHYETDTFVLLKHKMDYKGYNYRTTNLLDVVLVPIPDIVIVLTHGNVIIHQPLDEP